MEAEYEGELFIVALGDSYASGQGAPNEEIDWWKLRFWPKWDNRQCNRSKHAPTIQAVDRLREQGLSLGYRTYACSGATIEEGLVGPHWGPERPRDANGPLDPQVEQLQSLIDGGQKVDAVTISIGGNDILFQYIVLTCMFSKKCKWSRPLIEFRLDQLRCQLERLADALKEIDPNHPPRILMLEYPDPTRDPNGDFCNSAPPRDLLSGIDANEARWASEYVLDRLNSEIRAAASLNGWTYVDGIADNFVRRGWCAKEKKWINAGADALSQQGHFRGAMHPNEAGYEELGCRLAEKLAAALGKPGYYTCPLLSVPP